jgi:mono/diheme cytochrome c family protein
VQGLDLAGGLPGLVGTEYGHLLLLKMALFAGLLFLAAHNQFVLARDLTRLRRWVVIEAVMGCVTLCAASLLSASPPGLHEQPWWPFAWRPDLSALADDEVRLAVQNAVAMGLLVLATWLRRARAVLVLGSLAAVWFASPSLGLLLVPAEPTVFWESSADATPQSIALGRAAYAMHCANCHGQYLRGDGPGSAGLAIPPADLTAPHLWDHLPGQVFWWISDGMRGPDGSKVMPGFADRIDARTRWALIDFLHANNPYGSVRAGTHRH